MKDLPIILNLALRIIFLMICLAATAAIIFICSPQALAAALKPVSVIEGDVFTAGDLFDGISPEQAARVLGPAPQPGTDLVLNARTLMQVSLALDLPWKPVHNAEQVIVRRASTVVGEEELSTLISDEIRAKGIEERFDVQFTGSAPKMILPQGQPQTAEMVSFTFDPQKDLFRATFAAPSKDLSLSQASVTGKIQRYTSVPVLKSSMRNGDIIGAHDLMWIDLPAQDVQPDMLLTEGDLEGLTPRRLIAAGKPVRDQDMQKPRRVSRGEFVTIVYESGPIILTAKGKALQDGADGDMVRIVNVSSNKSLEGIVSGDRQVTIEN